jgi:hypothetical protein
MRHAVVVVGGLLLAAVAVGCQTMEPMSRPDAEATLERPGDWVREGQREENSVLYFIRHPSEPVHVQLRRLDQPLVEAAHPVWVQLWLEELYDGVDEVEVSSQPLEGGEATRVRASASWQDEPLGLDILITNAAGQTFVLEAWGVPSAMSQTAEQRQRIEQSAQLPSGAAAIEQDAPVEVDGEHWRLVVPSPPTDEVEASWDIDQPTDGQAVFELAGLLISAELLVEQLPYPIGADRYAHEALDNDGDPPDSDRRAVTVVDTDDAIVRTHRFVTRGERAAHLVVSTPEPLYDLNRETIEALIDSLAIDSDEAAGPPDGEQAE